jgi:histone arginine demethylase JMJD6
MATLGDLVRRAKALARPRCVADSWPQISAALATAPPLRSAGASGIATLDGTSDEVVRSFRREHEDMRRPALLRGLTKTWPAMPSAKENPRAWTFENLTARLGGEIVHVGETDDGEDVPVPLGAFCEGYMREQRDRNPLLIFDAVVLERLRLRAEGIGRARDDDDSGGPIDLAEALAQDLSRDYEIPALFARDDCLGVLDELERPPHEWILLAPRRSGSPVHTDPMATNAWNALLVGVKRWALFHPDTPHELLRPSRHRIPHGAGGGGYGGGGEARAAADGAAEETEMADDWEDVWGWFHEDLASIGARVDAYFEQRLRETRDTAVERETEDIDRPWRIEFDQRAGETVFVPAEWHHAVLNVTDTVAVTHNYVCASNLSDAWRGANAEGMEAEMAAKWRERMAAEQPALLHLMPPVSHRKQRKHYS